MHSSWPNPRTNTADSSIYHEVLFRPNLPRPSKQPRMASPGQCWKRPFWHFPPMPAISKPKGRAAQMWLQSRPNPDSDFHSFSTFFPFSIVQTSKTGSSRFSHQGLQERDEKVNFFGLFWDFWTFELFWTFLDLFWTFPDFSGLLDISHIAHLTKLNMLKQNTNKYFLMRKNVKPTWKLWIQFQYVA